jgi:hypothetical protein
MEKLNQFLETYLWCSVHASPKKWSTWLPLAEHWYNTNYHSALGKTPFEILYGYKPRHMGIETVPRDVPTNLVGWLQERAESMVLIRQHLLRAQQRMKSQEDKHRTEREFQVGDMVYMKLQPYAQTSMARR